MIIKYRHTLADLKAGLRADRPERRRSRVVGVLACAALVMFGGGNLAGQYFSDKRADADLRTCAWVCVAVGLAFFTMICAQEVGLTEDLRRVAEASEATSVAVVEHGLRADSRAATADWKWDRFRRFREGPGHFLLYHNAAQYLLFPKRAFADAADVETFRELLRRNIPLT